MLQCVWGEILLSNPRTATTSEAYHEEKGVYNAQRHESSALSSGSDGTLTKLLSNHFLFAGAISPLFLVFMAHHRDRFRPSRPAQGTGRFFCPRFGLKFNEENSERLYDFGEANKQVVSDFSSSGHPVRARLVQKETLKGF